MTRLFRNKGLLILLLFLACMSARPASALFEFHATHGRLDLTWWIPKEDGPSKLQGVWQMMPYAEWDSTGLMNGQSWGLATLPGDTGLALASNSEVDGMPGRLVYWLRVDLSAAREDLALFIPEEGAAFHVYADGRFVTGSGWPGGKKEWPPGFDTADVTALENSVYPVFAPLGPVGKSFDLVIVASSRIDVAGGLEQAFLLGEAEDLKKRYMRNLAERVFLAGLIVMLAALFLVYFILRPAMQQFLFLFLAALLGAFWVIVNGYLAGHFVQGFQTTRVQPLNLLTMSLFVPVYYGYYWRSYPQEFIRPIFIFALLWAGSAGVWIGLSEPARVLAVQGYLYVPLVMITIIVAGGLAQVWRAGRYAAPLAFSGSLLMLFLVLTSLFLDHAYSSEFINVGWVILGLLTMHAVMALRGYDEKYRQVLVHNTGLGRIHVRLKNEASTGSAVLREREERINRITARDRMTGLASRGGLLSRLSIECKRAAGFDRQLCLALIDIRQQQSATTSGATVFGPVDNALIPLIAEEIWSIATETDVVAHLGRGRFALVLMETDAAVMDEILHHLPQQLALMVPESANLDIRVSGQVMPENLSPDRAGVSGWLEKLERVFGQES